MSRRSRKEYPAKTILNLVITERPPYYYRNIAFAAAAAIVLIGVFAKFAVIDRLNAADAEWEVTDTIRREVDALKLSNTDFEDVQAEYDKYFANNAAKGTVVNCMEVLRIIDDRLLSTAHVRSASLSNNTLSVVLGGIDLDRATEILKELYEYEELVSAVELYTASSPGDAQTSIAMTIGLNPQGGAAQ